jgi:hypothetical protein
MPKSSRVYPYVLFSEKHKYVIKIEFDDLAISDISVLLSTPSRQISLDPQAYNLIE